MRIIATLLVLSCWLSTAFAQHRLLISDMLSKQVLILEKDGKPSWAFPEPGMVMDGEQLPNGNVLFCYFRGGKERKAGVKEVTPDHRVVFEFDIAEECHSVQRLPDGLTLIEDPAHRRLIEVDRDGKIIKEIKLKIGHDKVHHVARQCRKMPDGTYLVAQEADRAVVQYSPEGTVLKRIPIEGMVYGVSRLKNGNLLIGTGGGENTGKRVIEIDAAGRVVWSFEPTDFPADTNLDWVLGAQRLSNGNTLIPNFLGHGKNGKGISLLEVTPDKRVVWTLREPRIVLLAVALED